MIKCRLAELVYGGGPVGLSEPRHVDRPNIGNRARVQSRHDALLDEGTHSIELMFVTDSGEVILKYDVAIVNDVNERPQAPGEWMGTFPGDIKPRLAWSTDRCVEDMATP